MTGNDDGLAIEPQPPGFVYRTWWGATSRATGQWAEQDSERTHVSRSVAV